MKPGQREAEAFFVDWLQKHGEKDVVRTSAGVGVKGNATRLRARIYNTADGGVNGRSAETEFRVTLPSGQEIVEYVTGLGKTEEEALTDSLANFMLTTLHPIYASCINTRDPHQVVEEVVIDSHPRKLVMGDLYIRSAVEGQQEDFALIRDQLRSIVTSLPLGDGPHWIKIVYSQVHDEPAVAGVTVDNADDASLTRTVTALDWPRRDEFYMVKEFVMIQ